MYTYIFTCILLECCELNYTKLDEINQLSKNWPKEALFEQQQ